MTRDELYTCLTKCNRSQLDAVTVKLNLNSTFLPSRNEAVATRASAILELVEHQGHSALVKLENALREVSQEEKTPPSDTDSGRRDIRRGKTARGASSVSSRRRVPSGSPSVSAIRNTFQTEVSRIDPRTEWIVSDLIKAAYERTLKSGVARTDWRAGFEYDLTGLHSKRVIVERTTFWYTLHNLRNEGIDYRITVIGGAGGYLESLVHINSLGEEVPVPLQQAKTTDGFFRTPSTQPVHIEPGARLAIVFRYEQEWPTDPERPYFHNSLTLLISTVGATLDFDLPERYQVSVTVFDKTLPMPTPFGRKHQFNIPGTLIAGASIEYVIEGPRGDPSQ